uniref:Uncharacterized protein n=1 Tax=Astyanax mexicanus TaxID=7994 RepID=A0A3B1JCS5_ASTMX
MSLKALLPGSAESSRRFTKNLLKPGSAAEIRQTASSAVRNSTVTGIKESLFCFCWSNCLYCPGKAFQ